VNTAVAVLGTYGPAVTEALRQLDQATTVAWKAMSLVEVTDEEWQNFLLPGAALIHPAQEAMERTLGGRSGLEWPAQGVPSSVSEVVPGLGRWVPKRPKQAMAGCSVWCR
jgi:hypothetical protein